MRYHFIRASITSLLIFIGANAFPQQLSSQQVEVAFHNLIQTPGMESAHAGLYVIDLNDGTTVFSFNHNHLFTPASNVKLFTTAMGLEILGNDFLWITKATITGKRRRNGTLVGDLVISGSGDPTFSSMCLTGYDNNISSIFTFLKKNEIQKIRGAVYLKDTEEIKASFPPNWLFDDLQYYWGSGVYAFNYCDNSRFFSADNPDVRIYDTTGISSNTITLSDPDPWLSFTKVLNDTLNIKKCKRRNGGKSSQNRFVADYTMYSPSLNEIVKEINVESRNMWAEALLLSIGTEMGLEKDFELAADTLAEYWKEKLGFRESLFLYDGSGLSPYDAVTPQLLVELMKYMVLSSSEGRAFVQSIPEVGVSGTVKKLDYGGDLHPKILAKSGSFTRVRNYTGYILDNDGKPRYAFSLMMNGFTCSHEELIVKTGIFFSELFYDVLN